MTDQLTQRARARRWLTAASLSLLAVLIIVPGAQAGGWCRADPIVELEDEEVQIWVAIPSEYESHVDGPIAVRISVPGEVSTRVTMLDTGFNGHGEAVTFSKRRYGNDREFDARIKVEVPMDFDGGHDSWDSGQEVPVRVEVVYNGRSSFFYGDHHRTSGTVQVSSGSGGYHHH